MPGSRDGFAVARKTLRRWPHVASVVASGHVRPGPGDMPDGAHLIGRPFIAGMAHDHRTQFLPDGREPMPPRG